MSINKFEESKDTKAKITASTILYIVLVVFSIIALILQVFEMF
jgi:hypothetical protein